MKQIGIALLVVGLLMTVYTGFTYITKEKVVDIGAIEITKDNEHSVNWQPYVGVAGMVIGGAILMFGTKKSLIA